MKKAPELDRLFNPSSIAIIGASKEEQKAGTGFLSSLIEDEFKGKLYPVNPRESEIMRFKSYPSVLDVPGEVDLAIVAVPARIVPPVIAECSQKGVKFAVVHSTGFSELGAEGKKLEEEMLNSARQGNLRIIGPNCMGFYCPKTNINTIVRHSFFKEGAGPVAFVGQSGWASENFMLMGYECGLRFSKVVNIGNQSDLTIEDFLEYFASDADTRAIAFYIEGVKRGREFLQLARQISKNKPIIVWKAGRTETGVRAAASHTGSLAGNNAIFDTALKQSGVAIARSLEEVIDLTVGFTCPVLPHGNKVGLLVEAGGGAVAGADAAEALGLEIPSLSVEVQRELVDRLKGVIPPFSSPRNPVDLVWPPVDNPLQLFMQCARIILKEVDALVMMTYGVFNDYFVREVRGLRDEMGKPVFVVPAHPSERKSGVSLLTENGIPTFTMPERAFKALSAMVRYSNYLRQS